MTGFRFETCRICHERWNISVLAKIPWFGYTCPVCRAKRRNPYGTEHSAHR